MRRGTLSILTLLGAGWLLLAAVTAVPVERLGLSAAAATFLADFRQPWRAQFYTDFSLHLLLVAGWIFSRSRTVAAGLLGGALAILLGALFTLPYVAVALVRSRGDPARLLLGKP
jgi:hypothetical protein